MGFRCVEPKCQHHLLRSDLTVTKPREGIQSRYSGLRVQGTATSPPSTANWITLFRRLSDATLSIVCLNEKINSWVIPKEGILDVTEKDTLLIFFCDI